MHLCKIRKTALRRNAGAMATPEALDIEAQQLEDKADRLGNEAIDLEKQQLKTSAKAKLQEAETSRVNARRKRDQADALRLQISGVIHVVLLCISGPFDANWSHRMLSRWSAG